MGFLDLFSRRSSLQESGVLSGSTDRHSHVLFGVDDGVRTIDESLAVLQFEESLGIKEVWCTPHVMEDVPNTTDDLKDRFGQLKDEYAGPVKLSLAAEYMLDTVFLSRLRTNDLLTMEDDTLLVETSTIIAPYDLKSTLRNIMSEGYRPLFAHPERCRFLDRKDFEEMCSMGVRLQLNLPSLSGYYGTTTRTKAEWLLQQGLYSASGSDCHRLKVIKDQYSKPELTKRTITELIKLCQCQDC